MECGETVAVHIQCGTGLMPGHSYWPSETKDAESGSYMEPEVEWQPQSWFVCMYLLLAIEYLLLKTVWCVLDLGTSPLEFRVIILR